MKTPERKSVTRLRAPKPITATPATPADASSGAQVDLEGAEDHQGGGAEDEEAGHRAQYGADGLEALSAPLGVDQQAAQRGAGACRPCGSSARSAWWTQSRHHPGTAAITTISSTWQPDRGFATSTSSPRPSRRRSSRSSGRPGRRHSPGPSGTATGTATNRRPTGRRRTGTRRYTSRCGGRPPRRAGPRSSSRSGPWSWKRSSDGQEAPLTGAPGADRPEKVGRDGTCPQPELVTVVGMHSVWSKTLPASLPGHGGASTSHEGRLTKDRPGASHRAAGVQGRHPCRMSWFSTRLTSHSASYRSAALSRPRPREQGLCLEERPAPICTARPSPCPHPAWSGSGDSCG